MSSPSDRILLSVAEVGPQYVRAVSEAVLSGWLSPAGPALDRFESELAAATDRRYAVGLFSGTAALHLGLLALGVRPPDGIWTSTLTFVATTNEVVHAGATPVFFDVDETTWTIDVNLVRSDVGEETPVVNSSGGSSFRANPRGRGPAAGHRV